MDTTLEALLVKRKLLLEKWNELQKEISELRRVINTFVVEEIIKMGLYKEKWTLIEKDFITYSEQKVYLVVELTKNSDKIKKYLQDIGNVECLPLEHGVTLRSSGTCQMTIEFTIGVDVKEFIRRNKLHVVDLNLQHEIDRLQRLQKEYNCAQSSI
jgi:hypothetical protein